MSKRRFPRRIGGSLLLAGILILLMGLYFFMFKAGIPAQDPTPAMQFQYAVDRGVGTALMKLGAVFSAIGTMLKLLFNAKG